MICFVKKHVKSALCLVLLLYCSTAGAQITRIENVIAKVESYHNFSYRSVNKRRDMSADTTIALNKEIFLKTPDNKPPGYLYSIETNHTTETFHRTELYNGEGLNILSAEDSTYFAADERGSDYNQSLIGVLKLLRERYNKTPFKITTLPDTIINGTTNSHFMANVRDTIDNNEHLYAHRHYYIDKQTSLPSLVIIRGRYEYSGAVNNYYDETRYFDYKLNRTDITDADFVIPKYFKPRKDQTIPELLAAGTTAPDWTLYDANGKKLTLSQLKGKVVVLDFYFIGCAGCMLSIKPLNAIYEKYKNSNLVIASLTERDGKKAVLDFEKRYQIKYPCYINAAGVVKSYHVSAFPTYYFIDKEGKIDTTIVGYNDDFEKKVTSVIDKLFGKK
jgi:peroxiredoxin